MDFEKLLCSAQKNKEIKKEPIRYYSTKFEPPKKEKREKNQLSANIKKFLEKRELEEKQKAIEALKKKEELLSLRAKDKKAVKRVNVMLKRTKSANQSVIKDAVDSNNTAVTINGPAQPDEDDYGYVSQEAAAFYNKMMEKYSKMPEEPCKLLSDKKKVNTNLKSTKDRVKAALEKEKEEAMMPHKRKRKTKSEEGEAPVHSNSPSEVEEYKPEAKKIKIDKPKPKMPPPMSFNDLLKLAEKKQFEPVIIKKETKEDETPLTKKQKMREMEERAYLERKKERQGTANTDPKGTLNKPEKPTISNKTQKQSKLAAALTKGSNKNDSKVQNPEPERKKIDWGAKHPSACRMNTSVNSTTTDHKKTALLSASNSNSKNTTNNLDKTKMAPKTSMNGSERNGVPSKDVQKTIGKRPTERNQLERMRETEKSKPKQFPPRDLQPKQFPPRDLQPKQFPPRDLQPKRFPPDDFRRPTSKKVQMKKRRIIDDDSDEYDSEMDDFIDDDTPEDYNNSYSKHIQEIFGYNKSKYANYDDDDDDNMESSFSQMMQEEQISTKLGIMEDLEDMKKEEEYYKQKALRKKQMRR